MAPLKIQVLVDNCTQVDQYYLAEPGLSLYLEADGKSVLFDTGYSNIFISNAIKMGINLLDLDYVIFSHGHIDHTGGLPYLSQVLREAKADGLSPHVPEIISHPSCFMPRHKGRVKSTGSPFSLEQVSSQFPVRLSAVPVKLTGHLTFLGEIPRKEEFEKTDPGDRVITLPDGTETPDTLTDDSAMVYETSSGLVVITGCSHAGICNILRYSRELLGNNKIIDIIGGLHLLSPAPDRIDRTVGYIKRINPEIMHPCHCTDLLSKTALMTSAPLGEVGVGWSREYY